MTAKSMGDSAALGELECAWRRPLGKDALSSAQQDWIDQQQDLIRKAVFEQPRCQR
jgi:hypothetical protein